MKREEIRRHHDCLKVIDMTGLSTLCYIEQDGKYLMLHRTVKKNDVNKDKWIGVGGHFEADESPEECVLREVKEETGYTLTSYRYRGIVTFVSGNGVTEYMSLFTADGFEGEPVECDEGELAWLPKEQVWNLNLWEGDRIFFRLLEEEKGFFSLKLVYDGKDGLVSAALNGKPMELFDILDDETGEKTGLVRERGVAHRFGSPHGTVHIWIVREHPSGESLNQNELEKRYDILLQKRSSIKDSNPGCYDISSAGHMDAGDGIMESALRELHEEIGIKASGEELHYVGRRHGKFEAVFHGRPFRDNEWSNMFVYEEPVDITKLSLQESEVESVMWMDFDTLKKAVRENTIPHCIYVDELEMLEGYLKRRENDGK